MHNTAIIKQRSKRRDRGLYRILTRNYGQLPIISVHKSNKHLYVNLNNFDSSKTLMSFTSKGKNIESAQALAGSAAKTILDSGISAVVFNKNGYKFHGVVKTIYNAIKEVGITC